VEQESRNIDISNFLPHQAPMLMVSRLRYVDDTHVEAEFDVTEDCIFVRDGRVAESGVIENLAQVCSAVIGQSFFEKDDLEGKGNKVVGYINSLTNLKITSCAQVGQTMVTKAEMISRFDLDSYSICKMECSASVADNLSVTCTLNFLIHEIAF
jgi:3-hydroxyacyl-[acyl-carrier-protein] dehydratase